MQNMSNGCLKFSIIANYVVRHVLDITYFVDMFCIIYFPIN